MSNFIKIKNYYKLVYSKSTFIKYLKDESEFKLINWTVLTESPNILFGSLRLISNYNEKNPDKQIFPISRNFGSDIMIGIQNGRYCDFDTQMIEATIEYYDTPEEVWEKVIKPDIEAYYEITIDE